MILKLRAHQILLLKTYATNSFINKSYTISRKIVDKKMFLKKNSKLFQTFNFCLDVHVCNLCYNTADKNCLYNNTVNSLFSCGWSLTSAMRWSTLQKLRSNSMHVNEL